MEKASDPAMNAGILAAVLGTMTVLSSVGSYIQYTHASGFTNEESHKNVSNYMAISAITMLLALIMSPVVCFQAGVWATRDGVPANEVAAEVAFMPGAYVIMFYSTIGLLVMINAYLSVKAHSYDIQDYEEEESPLTCGTVKWRKVAEMITYANGAMAVSALAITAIIAHNVLKAADQANVRVWTATAKSAFLGR